MQYMLLIHSDERAMQQASESDIAATMAAYGAYTRAMSEAGVLRAGDRLHPASKGVVVRHREGKSQVLNGPYAEAKEQLGGYYIMECADLDAAIAWAARCPGAQMGSMEVRQIWAM